MCVCVSALLALLACLAKGGVSTDVLGCLSVSCPCGSMERKRFRIRSPLPSSCRSRVAPSSWSGLRVGSPAAEWLCPGLFIAVWAVFQCLALVAAGIPCNLLSQVRNELTMYGRVGTLADDLIRFHSRKRPIIGAFVENMCTACRWSDGSVWARCDTDAAWKHSLLEQVRMSLDLFIGQGGG